MHMYYLREWICQSDVASKAETDIQDSTRNPFRSIFINRNIIQIYPVSEGYLRKILVERRGKYPEPL